MTKDQEHQDKEYQEYLNATWDRVVEEGPPQDNDDMWLKLKGFSLGRKSTLYGALSDIEFDRALELLWKI